MKYLIIFMFSTNLYATNLICTAKKYSFDIIVKKKTVNIEGRSLGTKIKLHVENTDNLNINDDYLIILNKDHNVTLPLKCIKKIMI